MRRSTRALTWPFDSVTLSSGDCRPQPNVRRRPLRTDVHVHDLSQAVGGIGDAALRSDRKLDVTVSPSRPLFFIHRGAMSVLLTDRPSESFRITADSS